ncbi:MULTISPECIES: SH3 domain-containing protein [unclassified Streptomyces]|uniref:SH3 domain-containing protein n=1 Tax=unclassified Streptomyces TaxID=2593676 RepID=UPI0022B6B60F|nr:MULTISPECIES: SH3 domain-containing protein [unclassified Streptomyces]MCZ7413485.1 SH3 domain-containing protein [Streptomyces sp. WMMC897]MCZ7430479.1 SH3 domain-containing protein [Streptomyces sp. WMMC1477]
MLKSVKTTVALTAGALTLSVLGAAPALAGDEEAKATTTQTAPAAAGVVEETADHTAEAAAHARWGKVIARTGLNIRKKPTTHSKIVGGLPYGAKVKIICKVNGQTIKGNPRWYKLAHHKGWVTARYVKNLNYIPWCRH